MVPIAFDSQGQKFDQASLQQHLIELCEKHQAEKRALAFAFLVYDFQSAAMRKMLDDTKYWEALHALSGEYLSVLYFDSKDKLNKPNVIDLDKINSQEFEPWITSVSSGKTPLDGFISTINQLFNIKENFSPPFIVFFQTDNLKIIDSHFISLSAERTAE